MHASWRETMPRAVTKYRFSQGLIYNSVYVCGKKRTLGFFFCKCR